MGVYDTRWLYIYIYNWEIGWRVGGFFASHVYILLVLLSLGDCWRG
jgi:hypothetical protein